jgi:hypothetical protein
MWLDCNLVDYLISSKVIKLKMVVMVLGSGTMDDIKVIISQITPTFLRVSKFLRIVDPIYPIWLLFNH